MGTIEKIDAIISSLKGDTLTSGTFDPAASPATGGYGLKADDYKVEKQFGNRFTIYKGFGKDAGRFIVKGEGTNKTVSSYSEAYDMVQQLLKY